MTTDRSDRILSKLKKYYGDVSPDLRYENLYQLAIAVVLSARTTDVQVNAVTPKLFSAYRNFNELARADVSTVQKIIHGTGFYRNKAKNIIELSKKASSIYSNGLPSTREKLMELPGIGRKSANVILSIGFNTPAFAVDTHILRLAARLGYCEAGDPATIEKIMTGYIPENMWTYAHLVFIRHGRRTCRARNPLCGACPVTGECIFPGKTS